MGIPVERGEKPMKGDRPAEDRRLVMDSEAIRRTTARLAHEIIEAHLRLDSVVMVGIFTRGAVLARRLAGLVSRFGGVELEVADLDVTFYRDDLPLRKPAPARPSSVVSDLTGREVILVDDVLFTGRTVRAALDSLVDYGRPSKVRLVVLVDRGHRELPIRPDFVGKNLPTSLDEEVVVHLREIDGEDAVYIAASASRSGESPLEFVDSRSGRETDV